MKPVRLKDLPPNTNLVNIKVKLPAKALKTFISYGDGEKEMYPVGAVMGYGCMMSPDKPGTSERRLYPLPPEISQTEILEGKIVQ